MRDISVISSTQNEEMSSGNDEMEVELDVEAMQKAAGGKKDFHNALRKFRKDCENFARIAKISQGLRKFRKDCENFATIAKISQSQRKFRYAQFFAIIAKVTMHSENLNFAMPCIFVMIAQFRYHSEIFTMIAKFTT